MHACVQQALSLAITTVPRALISHMCIPYGNIQKIYDIDISPTVDLLQNLLLANCMCSGCICLSQTHQLFVFENVCFLHLLIKFKCTDYSYHGTLSPDQRKQSDHNDCNICYQSTSA